MKYDFKNHSLKNTRLDNFLKQIIDRLRRRLAQKDSDIKKLLEKIRQQEVVIKRQETDIANYQSLYGLALD